MNSAMFGGRKFAVALTVLVAGIAIEFLKPKGLTVEMIGFLLGLVAAFSVSNVVSKQVTGGLSEAPSRAVEITGTGDFYSDTSSQDARISILEAQVASIEAAGTELIDGQQKLAKNLQALVTSGIFKKGG